MIIRAAPLPDELAHGFMGRIRLLNGALDGRRTILILRRWAGYSDTSPSAVPIVQLLARVADMTTPEFVVSHTLLPLSRAIASWWDHVAHGSDQRVSLLNTVAMYRPRREAYFCIECIKEDIGFLGFDYWRREHQVPGCFSCFKHGRALWYVGHPRAFDLRPSSFVNVHAEVNERWAARLRKSIPVQRFLSITADLLDLKGPLQDRPVSRAVRKRAKELGLHTGRGAATRPLISDLVGRLFDSAWLQSTINGWEAKRTGVYWRPIDIAGLGNATGIGAVNYALVFAALFQTADDAMNAMLSPPAPARRSPMPGAPPVTSEALRRSYIEARGNSSALARQVGLSRDAALSRLARQGLPPLPGLNSGRLGRAAKAFLVDGLSLAEACTTAGASIKKLEELLRVAGAPLRSAILEMRDVHRRVTSSRRAVARGPISPPSVEADTIGA